ncbi:MAG: glycosyltransferase [Phycisphaerae bacterium]
MSHTPNTTGPFVSVLVPTYNRRRYLAEALASIVAQTYEHFEAIVINDGGVGVRDVVDGFADPRLVLIDRADNRGKAASLNEGLERARGTYVAYLDDDDLYYPHHLERLVETLEGPTDCGVAYTDLYKAHCRIQPDGSRQVLGKVVNISRDFDRFFQCYFNHTLHVAAMHRRDLLERAGPYDESLGILVDWDLMRRLAFFTDFVHVPEVTGEFFAPVANSDRISEKGRGDRQVFMATVLKIRTARPPKPWPKMPDLSIVLLPETAEAAALMVRQVYAWTFVPHEIYLPMPQADLDRLGIRMPNFVPVPVEAGTSLAGRLDAAVARAGGDYVAVVPHGTPFHLVWVEDALHAALAGDGRTAFALGEDEPTPTTGFVLPTEVLARVRRGAGGAPVAEALRAAGITLRAPAPDEYALRFDRALQEAQRRRDEGNPLQAAAIYAGVGEQLGNTRWMRECRAHTLYEAGGHDAGVLGLCRDLNRRPRVSTLLLEGRVLRRAGRFEEAVDRLEHARRLLAPQKGTPCN